MKNKKNIIFLLYFLAVMAAADIGFFHKKDIMTFGEEKKAYLAVIIDDFGYGGEGTDQMLALDIDFTAAVMPFSERSAEDVEKIKNAGKDYIVHMPMESLTGKKSWVGDKGVFLNMTDEEIKCTVNEALEIVDGASGLNNHMGSAIMENERCLGAVFDVLAERDMLFVDSMTTAKSLGEKLGREKGVDVLKRDVFLDSTDDINKVKENLRHAADVALKKGYAVAIGHVGPEGGKITAQALADLKCELEEKGIEFVTVSRLRDLYEGGGNN